MDLQAKKATLEQEIAEKQNLAKQAREQAKTWMQNANIYDTQVYGLQQKLELLNELMEETEKIQEFKESKSKKKKTVSEEFFEEEQKDVGA